MLKSFRVRLKALLKIDTTIPDRKTVYQEQLDCARMELKTFIDDHREYIERYRRYINLNLGIRIELARTILNNEIPYDINGREEYFKTLKYEIDLEKDRIKYIKEVSVKIAMESKIWTHLNKP
ncbi:MAG: hypothetical protein JEZ08_16755 [Clostridiales bacterium]|nr:hypothetical protein [Clostridiales bacterium]